MQIQKIILQRNLKICLQKNFWLKQPEFRLFQPGKNVTESHTSNSI